MHTRHSQQSRAPHSGRAVTRRAFLETLPFLATGAFVTTSSVAPAVAAGASEPHISFPTEPRDRIAIASYPFRAFIDSPNNRDRNKGFPSMDLTQFPAQIVSKFNIRNFEPHSRHFRSFDSSYLSSLREAMDQAGVRAVDIAVSADNSFYDADSAARNQAIGYAKTWIDVAVSIGSPGIRTHIRTAKNSPPNVERAAESLRKVTDYAAEKNVVINLENDDLVSEDAFFLVKVIEAVNHPYLRALPDFANSMMSGDADFDYRALAAMFQHAYCICHVKDGEANDSGKILNIDLKKSFDILKASGFRGYCSMEFDAPGDPYAATTKLIEQTLKFLS